MIQHADVALQYDRERIFRRLKIEPGTHVHDYAMEAFPALARAAEEKLRMVHCYTLLEDAAAVGIPEVDGCDYQVACLSACSQDIMAEIGRLLERGDYLEGYILNDLSNEILFNASDQMNHRIAGELAAMDCRLTRRFSPGESELALEYQAQLLGYFREDPSLDFVTLTDSYMLMPEKSMLYLFGADRRNPERSVEHDCSQCPNVNCFFRQEGAPTSFCP